MHIADFGLQIEESALEAPERVSSRTPKARLGKSTNTYLERPLCPQIAWEMANSPSCLKSWGESLCYATVISQAGAVASKECSRAEIQECAGPA